MATDTVEATEQQRTDHCQALAEKLAEHRCELLESEDAQVLAENLSGLLRGTQRVE